MEDIFSKGDIKKYEYEVMYSDIAKFEYGIVHEVCSTFILAREMEWSSRLFVLEMKEEHEEGIGTMLEIDHKSPAFVGDELDISATIDSISGNEIICLIEVKVGDRLVATGRTGQKVIPKLKIESIFNSIQSNE